MPNSPSSPTTRPLPGGFKPKRSADYVRSARPVVGLKDEYPAGFIDETHSHTRTQLLYARSGVMSVVTEHCTYAVPPQRALWMRAGTRHEVSCHSNVSLRTLYIDPELGARNHEACHLLEVSEFLQSLILEVVNFDTGAPMDERQQLIMRLLLEEIWRMPDAPYKVMMPRDERLCRACRRVIENPAQRFDLDGLAEVACMSRRAFTRLFRQETGTSFGDWQRQTRLVAALSLMESGRSISLTAYDVGYSSPSAFSAAFHRTFGVPPTQYRAPQRRY